jgi:hypothetical protein
MGYAWLRAECCLPGCQDHFPQITAFCFALEWTYEPEAKFSVSFRAILSKLKTLTGRGQGLPYITPISHHFSTIYTDIIHF